MALGSCHFLLLKQEPGKFMQWRPAPWLSMLRSVSYWGPSPSLFMSFISVPTESPWDLGTSLLFLVSRTKRLQAGEGSPLGSGGKATMTNQASTRMCSQSGKGTAPVLEILSSIPAGDNRISFCHILSALPHTLFS